MTVSRQETRPRHDTTAPRRHTPAHALPMSALGLGLAAVALASAACGGNVVSSAQGGHGNHTTSSITDTTEPISCLEAQDGDPCVTPGESCGVGECYGCFTQCVGGAWKVSCSEPPACPAQPPPERSTCDDFCGPFSCGGYEVQTPCGQEFVTPVCTGFGWDYQATCKPDCSAYMDPGSCDATVGCAWVNACEGSPDMLSGCVPFHPSFQPCSANPCPLGQTCHDVHVNPDDLHSTDCTGASAAISICSQ